MSKESQELRMNPSAAEAESALLGCIIQGGEREQEVAMAWIREDDAFYVTDNRTIWESMSELYKDGVSIDFVTPVSYTHLTLPTTPYV